MNVIQGRLIFFLKNLMKHDYLRPRIGYTSHNISLIVANKVETVTKVEIYF